ncbi:MAG TPA: hypothetical protein PKD00_03180 [Burkholderiales bacterium]|nr:hypothetical protein [Burkholderiales bacterium]
MNYKELLSRSSETIAEEQLNLRVQQAELNLAQGELSLKSKLLTEESAVKLQESILKQRKQELQNVKSSEPVSLSQNLINAFTAVEQAELDLLTAQESYQRLLKLFSFFEQTKAELFG